MIKNIIDDAKDRMEKSLNSIQSELSTVRTGRASPSLLDSVRVDYYGSNVPLKQVANIAVPEPRMLTVHPWDRSMLSPIEKAIIPASGVLIRVPRRGRIDRHEVEHDTDFAL